MSLLGGAGALAVALVLLAAGVGHLRDPRGLRSALAAHDVLPSGMQRPLALVLGPVELVLGALLLLSLSPFLSTGDTLGAPFFLTGDTIGSSVTLGVAIAATLLTGAFTAYLFLVLRRTGGAEEIPCGCGLGTTPVGPWAVLRAGLLAGLALLAVVGGTPDWATLAGTDLAAGAATAAPPLWAHVGLVAAAGLTLAIAVAALPAARAVPPALTTLAVVHTSGGHR